MACEPAELGLVGMCPTADRLCHNSVRSAAKVDLNLEPDQPVSEALRNKVARLRTRLAMAQSSHFAFGAGCSCGLSMGHIDTSTLDTMIGTHLAEKYAASGASALAGLFKMADAPGGLARAMEALPESPALTDSDRNTAIDDLETAIGSLEEMSGGKSSPRFRADGL